MKNVHFIRKKTHREKITFIFKNYFSQVISFPHLEISNLSLRNSGNIIQTH